MSSLTSPAPPQILSLSVVLPSLSTIEHGFFEKLDRELDKIETFYRSRESEAIIRYVYYKTHVASVFSLADDPSSGSQL